MSEKSNCSYVFGKDSRDIFLKENSKFKVPKLVILLLIIIVLVVAGYFIISSYKGNDFSDNNITYSIRR